MARHIWLNKTFLPETLEYAAIIFGLTRLEDVEYPLCYSFTGYHMERGKQEGRMDRLPKRWANYMALHSTRRDLGNRLRAAIKSGHRYAFGRNAENYSMVGRKMITDYIRGILIEPPSSDVDGLLRAIAAGGGGEHCLVDALLESNEVKASQVLMWGDMPKKKAELQKRLRQKRRWE